MRHSHPSSEVKIYYGIISTGEIDIITMHWNESPECEPRFRVHFAFLEGKFSDQVGVKDFSRNSSKIRVSFVFWCKKLWSKAVFGAKVCCRSKRYDDWRPAGSKRSFGTRFNFFLPAKIPPAEIWGGEALWLEIWKHSNYFIVLTSHRGEWQLKWVLRGKHIFFSLRATSHNEITKMKGPKLPLIFSDKTWKWKRTNDEYLPKN